MMNALKFWVVRPSLMAPDRPEYGYFPLWAFVKRRLAVADAQDRRSPAESGRLLVFGAGMGAW